MPALFLVLGGFAGETFAAAAAPGGRVSDLARNQEGNARECSSFAAR